MKKTWIFILWIFQCLILSTCVLQKPPGNLHVSEYPVNAEREFRAAWVATVANVNWPSKPGLPVEEQKKEAVRLLDLLQKNNFNAVIFQVRPQCDALYNSSLETWSYYLTGEQGKAPEPYYDPLEFWVDQAHLRGLELHTWLNPYRAHHSAGGEVTDASIVRKYPDLAIRLKNGMWWLDPSMKGTQDHSYSVVMDIVRRYDIDGMHFDDYFYPYPSYNDGEDFPDDKSWDEYRKGGGKLSRGDWRRENVNLFIERVYRGIKKEKPHVKFGLSPFGIWRPGHPASIGGFDQYDQLYADAKLWLNKGWIDYYTPQLYWPINRITQSYPVLLGWWQNENTKNRHLWPGINIGQFQGEQAVDETFNQIMIARGILPNSSGNVHWSIRPLVNDPLLARALVEGPYRKQALVPASPWIDKKPPLQPDFDLNLKTDSVEISIRYAADQEIFQWVVYFQYNKIWDYRIIPALDLVASIPRYSIDYNFLESESQTEIPEASKYIYPVTGIAVSAVDRNGNESTRISRAIENTTLPGSLFVRKIIEDHRIAAALDETRAKPARVTPGINILIEEHLDLIRDKRVGLVTNPSAAGADLQSDIDLLANTPGVNLVALFGAEHGVRGARQGRIFQDGEPDPVTGIPVYSLYGESFAPLPEWLDSLDVMLFDIQGVGSAWYTFKYSLSFVMEACAKSGVSMIVLDRPNPLGGTVVEGPMLDLGGIFRHKLPLRHGMTYGELASMWNETEGFNADLTVIQMKGYRRNMMWNDTGLTWILPSPNMGTFETAVVYPGQCLFERSNISEARGTTKPFLFSGAPWIDGEKAAHDLNSRNIPGAIFRPVYFIPEKLREGDNPRNKPWNRLCSGVEIILTDVKMYRPVETSLHIIDAYRKTNPDSLTWTPPYPLDELWKEGTGVDQILLKCQEETTEFFELRKKYLLYR